MQMKRWIFVSMGAFAFCTALPSRAQPELFQQELPQASPILADYDFEVSTASGPDSFWVREPEGGEVALSRAFRVEGERSLHISEVPGNRDFAEFLAYFSERSEGSVFVQFYLLITDAEQRFNFGLAGREWFLSAEKDGHAVWLQTADGSFRHRPNEGWRELFTPRLFAWYFVDLVYRVDLGTYDLAIYEEGVDEPVVDLYDERSLNGHRGSSVRYFSLIGDLEDAGRFDFFVDDLLIASDPAVLQKPFVAPGRRRYFVEMLGIDEPSAPQELEDLFWQAESWLGEELDREGLNRLEAAGDQAFLVGRLDLATEIFERAAEDPARRVRLLLKLSDLAHLRGDVESERRLRESIYGSLEFEEHKTP